MSRTMLAGALVMILGIVLFGKTDLIWRFSEHLRNSAVSEPSSEYMTVSRMLGVIFIIIGILLVLGIFH